MAFKTIVTLLLLSCLSATVTSLGVTKEPLQEGRALPLPPELTITEVHWLLSVTSTTVQICTSDDLPVGLPALAYDDGTSNPVNVDGGIDDVKPNCANFLREVVHKPNQNSARYELIVTEKDHPGNFLGRGVTTFPITVRTTLLTCGSGITKITWSAEEIIPDAFCVEEPATLDKACYHNEDLTDKELCFTVNDGVNIVNVCLKGLLDASSSTGAVSTNYFYYGPESINSDEAEATLSLTVDTLVVSNLRAIVRLADDPENPGTPGKAHIYDCPSSECKISLYKRKFAKYEVCVEAMNDVFDTEKTGTTTFTDLNLNAFDGGSQKSTLLELVFANGLEPHNYLASLYEEEPSATFGDPAAINTANLDCTSVAFGNACFGFLDTSTAVLSPVYLAISAMDGTPNTIIVPYSNTPIKHGPRIGHQ